MNLQRIYDQFIADRRLKESSVSRGEWHHIKPRCLGGGDEDENLILLTCSDHLFAHILLGKIHGGRLAGTVTLMLGTKKHSGRKSRLAYEAFRLAHKQEVAANNRSRVYDDQYRANIRAGLSKPEVVRKKSENCSRQHADPEMHARMTTRDPSKVRRGWRHSEETKRKQREARMSMSPEARSEAARKASHSRNIGGNQWTIN